MIRHEQNYLGRDYDVGVGGMTCDVCNNSEGKIKETYEILDYVNTY